jgi:hypothetical protein
MLDRILNRRIGRAGCVAGSLIGIIACFVVYNLKDAVIYPPLLRSLPAPPGIVGQTDSIGAGAEITHFMRLYEVEQPYQEVASFFKEEMPKRGWRLIREDTSISPSEYLSGDNASVQLFFQGPYILPLRIWVYILAGLEGGTQIGRTHVAIHDPALTARELSGN